MEITIKKSTVKKGICKYDLFFVPGFKNKTRQPALIILPWVLISEESLEIVINAWDVLFFGVAEMKDAIKELFFKVKFWPQLFDLFTCETTSAWW